MGAEFVTHGIRYVTLESRPCHFVVGPTLSNKRTRKVALGKSALSPDKFARGEKFGHFLKPRIDRAQQLFARCEKLPGAERRGGPVSLSHGTTNPHGICVTVAQTGFASGEAEACPVVCCSVQQTRTEVCCTVQQTRNLAARYRKSREPRLRQRHPKTDWLGTKGENKQGRGRHHRATGYAMPEESLLLAQAAH
jgi:hypothetical protein